VLGIVDAGKTVGLHETLEAGTAVTKSSPPSGTGTDVSGTIVEAAGYVDSG
jgi:hypothetical protein